MDYLEAFKVIGAGLGFVSTAIVIWDRMFRYRPSISLAAVWRGGEGRVQLRIKNQAPYDIVVERIWCSSRHYAVNSADTVLGSVLASVSSNAPVLLAPGEERLLRVAEIEIDRKAPSEVGRLVFCVQWTRGDHPLLRPCPVWVWSSFKDIMRRKRAAELRAGELREER
jgi:hypothetical protein